MKNILRIDITGKRVFGLDILRSIAILFVLLEHGINMLPKQIGYIIGYIGLDGVSIFFVLSGFLIGGILIRVIEKEEASFKTLFNFWIRRWFRTIPNYFLCLSLLILCYISLNKPLPFSFLYQYFTFSQDLFYPDPAWFFPEAWSLSVEEWFYILVPLCMFTLVGIFKVNKRKAILNTALSFLLLITLFRLFRFYSLQGAINLSWEACFRKQVITRLDSLMYGVVCAYIATYYQEYWLRYKKELLIGGIILLVASKIIDTNFAQGLTIYSTVFSFSFNAFATALLIPFLSSYNTGKGILYKAITRISLISYSLYLLNLSLVHDWILNYFLKLTPTYWSPQAWHIMAMVKYFLYWVITFVIAIILYKYFEVPTTNLRNKTSLK